MKLKTSFITLSAVIFLMSNPAGATIYSWEDESGAVTFSDDPTRAPSDAQVKVWSSYSAPPTTPEARPAETTASAAIQNTVETAPDEMTQDQESPLVATQGEFAVELVAELGLGMEVGEEEAIDLLTRARIAPPLGEWEPDQPMTPELTVRLRTLTVAATQEGWLSLTPEQALLAFDTTAALLGVAIPATPAPESPENPDSDLDVPPLVYVTPPPPAVVSYYSWFPVAGGFWWYGTWFDGFFILTNFHSHPFHHHRFFFDTHDIRHRFADRVFDHPFKKGNFNGNPGNVRQRGFTVTAVPSSVGRPDSRSRSHLNPPPLPQLRFRSGMRPSIRRPAVQRPPARRPFIYSRPIVRSAPVSPLIRRENRSFSSSFRSFASTGRPFPSPPRPQMGGGQRPHGSGHASGSNGPGSSGGGSGSFRHR
jgi:uncharacterized membrane protein YgcG